MTHLNRAALDLLHSQAIQSSYLARSQLRIVASSCDQGAAL